MSAQPKHDLQKSAQQLLDEMEKLITGSQNPAFNTQLAMRALHKFAGVLAVVSIAADKHSRRLVVLTAVLLVFTAVLLGYTILLYQYARADAQHRNFTEHHQLQAPSRHHKFVTAKRPNQSLEPTASRSVVQFMFISFLQCAGSRAPARGGSALSR